MATPQPNDPSDLQPDPNDRARGYKSRIRRPCDFCRFKKAACHLDSRPPCKLCIQHKRKCTFLDAPARRHRPNERRADSGDARRSSGDVDRGEYDRSPFSITAGLGVLRPWDSDAADLHAAPAMSRPNFGLSTLLFHPFEPGLDQAAALDSHPGPDGYQQQGSIAALPWSDSPSTLAGPEQPSDMARWEASSHNQASSASRIIGRADEQDRNFLSRYCVDEHIEAFSESIPMKGVDTGGAEGGATPNFSAMAQNTPLSKAQQRERAEILEGYRQEIDELVDDEAGRRLIRLFHKCVQPYFPLLRDAGESSDPRALPTCVLAAIYGHAIPFISQDEQSPVELHTIPSADAFSKIAWLACLPLLNTPSLAVLQALLLLLQRRSVEERDSGIPSQWTIATAAVSVAQMLGLHQDPTTWVLPTWEIKVRRRLAWATLVQDKWLALSLGRNSHVQVEDWGVGSLVVEDLEDADSFPSDPRSRHFIKLCELTVILDDIMNGLFSVRALEQLHDSLEATIDVAKPLRIRLTEWYQFLPAELLLNPTPCPSSSSPRRHSSTSELDGNGCLHLAYLTARVELFRALLRSTRTGATANAVTALRGGALAIAKEAIEFLGSLTESRLAAFWASYSRTNFAIVSDFLLFLFITSASIPDAKECRTLLETWHGLVRIRRQSCHLLDLALSRLDVVLVPHMETVIELSPAAKMVWQEAAEEVEY